jgi:hypothetical protein
MAAIVMPEATGYNKLKGWGFPCTEKNSLQ